MLAKISSNKIVYNHALVWIIYTLYFATLIKHFYNYPLSIAFISQTTLHRLGDVFLFYTCASWIFPKYLYLKKTFYLFLTFVFAVSCYVYYYYSLEFYIFQFLGIIIPNDKPVLEQVISMSIVQASNFVVFSLGYYFSQRIIQQQREIAEKDIEIANQKVVVAEQKTIVAEQQLVLVKKEKELAEEKEKNAILAKEKAQAEMAFLRAQINPHFLFNTLNLIYSKAITAPKEVLAEIILEFSDMMKYATSTNLQEDTVDLYGEVTFVEQYLSLLRHRNQKNFYVIYQREPYLDSHQIVPMVLITLVENAVKHGLIDDPKNPVIITAHLKEDVFIFRVKNLINPYPNDVAGKGNTGVGVVNIIKRLNAVYKNGGFSLTSEKVGTDYIATFTVDFNIINIRK